MRSVRPARRIALAIHTSVLVVLAAFACAPAGAAALTVSFTPEVTSGGLGGLGSINATLQLAGTEYGGFPPPTTAVALSLPAGTTLAAVDHQTCSKAVLEQTGPRACQRSAIAGPVGTALGIVSFGSERVEESATVEPFYSPEGGLLFFIDGHSPVSLEILASAAIAANVIKLEVPLVSTVPGADYASITKLELHLGETRAEEEASHLQSGLTLPAECAASGFSWSVAVTSDENGANPIQPQNHESAAATGCPGPSEPVRLGHEEEVKKHHEEEAELVQLRATVKRLEEELRASVVVEKVKVKARSVLITIRAAEPGDVTIAGRGLKRTVMLLSAGTHQITAALTRVGRAERKDHTKIKLLVSLKVGGRTVSVSKKARL
jgi:hypothetical protein